MKRILLTGDDGYQSIGTRLVIRALKSTCDLTVVATKSQMSGVGGHVTLKTGVDWGEDTIDGVKALWVDGYPADAMEFVAGNFPIFDYIISGINLGANVGPGFPSGTVAAAVHGLALHNAKKAIILSWHVAQQQYLRIHNGTESLDPYESYPLKPLRELLQTFFKKNLWGAAMVNVNFPESPTNRIRMTRPVENMQTFYEYPIEKNINTHHFDYMSGKIPSSTNHKPDEEVGALMENVISVTPWRKNLFDEEVFTKISEKEFTL